jgi:hypothetical protein
MKIIFTYALLIMLSTNALADEPLPQPSEVIACSASGDFCATSNPLQKVTSVRHKGAEDVLWTLPGWHRWLFVSNDGESVVVGYDGMNLVPQNSTLDVPVLFFYHHGRLVRTVKLSDLYQRKSQLNKTASHFAWVRQASLNASGRLILELVDGRKAAFAAETGEPQR